MKLRLQLGVEDKVDFTEDLGLIFDGFCKRQNDEKLGFRVGVV